LVVDPDPPKGRSYPSRQECYAIEDWETLPPAEANVLAPVLKPDQEWHLYALFLLGFFVMGLYLWLWSVYETSH
jgi:hypothetical protein